MRKRDMMARIEALERRVAQLEAQIEAQRTGPYVEPWPVIPTTAPDYPPPQTTRFTCSTVNTGYDPLTTTVAPYDKDYTYEGMFLEDRDAYAG